MTRRWIWWVLIMLALAAVGCNDSTAPAEQKDDRTVTQADSPPISAPEPPKDKPASDPQFTKFMSAFFAAYKAKDWPQMTSLVRAEPRCNEFVVSLTTDELVTLNAGPGLKDWQTDWSGGEYVTSAKCVEVAMSIVAAAQDHKHAEDAVLSASQLSTIHSIWDRLYFTGLLGVGPAEDSMLIARIDELGDKLASATSIARLLKDHKRISLSLQATAWYQAKIGESQKADRFRRVSGSNLRWPPIWKDSGKTMMLMAEDTDSANSLLAEIETSDAATRNELKKDDHGGVVPPDYNRAAADAEAARHKDFLEKFYSLHKRADRQGMVALCRKRIDDAKFTLWSTTSVLNYFHSMQDNPILAAPIGDDTVRPAELSALVSELTQSLADAQKGPQ